MWYCRCSVLHLLVILSIITGWANAVHKLQEQFRWAALDYAYPDNNARAHDILTGRFNPANNLPVGIEIWHDKLFVTVPRWRTGIPSTLNYIPLVDSTSRSPALIPYPSWRANELGNCENGLNTVYRIKADSCNRLWVLDTGTFGIGNTTQNPCPYALNIFDLTTDTRIHRYVFRPEDINSNTFIANIAVDLAKGCDDAYAYFSDELGFGLIVYSLLKNRSWRFEHDFFLPDPLRGDFNIAGLNFQWREGVFGIALGPTRSDLSRTLFFSPLSSFRQFAVSTRVLTNETKSLDEADYYHDFVAMSERGIDAHTTSHVMSESGILFFNLIDRNAIGCWNSATSQHHPHNIGIVDKDDIGLIFPADVKVDEVNGYVWVISDRMSTFLLTPLDPKDINFRIFFAPLDLLVKGTVCEQSTPKLLPQRYLHEPISYHSYTNDLQQRSYNYVL